MLGETSLLNIEMKLFSMVQFLCMSSTGTGIDRPSQYVCVPTLLVAQVRLTDTLKMKFSITVAHSKYKWPRVYIKSYCLEGRKTICLAFI